MYRNRCDLHSHSSCSFDGEASMEAMCKRALEENLAYYAVTDHCECNKYDSCIQGDGPYRGSTEKAWREMAKCKEQFPGLRFLRGVELGQPLENLEAAADALSGRDYDIVIGSLHNIRGEEDFYHMGQRDLSREEIRSLYSRYFREMEEMISWGQFDTLAHILYPMRYLCAPGETPDIAPYAEQLERVMKALIAQDKALEFNTSRLLREGAPRLPDLEVFTLYKRLGGKLVTLGADAHCTGNLARGIQEGMDLLKQAGFQEQTVYVNRKPIQLPLE